jgi:bacteriorhodopsin
MKKSVRWYAAGAVAAVITAIALYVLHPRLYEATSAQGVSTTFTLLVYAVIVFAGLSVTFICAGNIAKSRDTDQGSQ